MSTEPLLRSSYAGTGSTARSESRRDARDYTQPLERIHSGLHGWGVSSGLQVQARSGTHGVQVLVGVAVDPDGRHVALAPGGRATLAAGTVDVPSSAPLDLPTAGLPDGTSWVTVGFAEEATSDIVRHAPVVALTPTEPDLPTDAVVLATVTLGTISSPTGPVSGVVTGLSADGRRGLDPGASQLVVRQPSGRTDGDDLVVEDGVAAVLRPASAGGLVLDAPSVTAPHRLGVGLDRPLGGVHARGQGGFVADGGQPPEDPDGVLLTSEVPLLAQSDGTVFGLLNSRGRAAFALNLDGDTSSAASRGVPTLYDKADGTWRAGISLKLGNVGIGEPDPTDRLAVRGLVRSTSGGRFNDVTVGTDGDAVDMVHESESVGVRIPGRNLRLQSPGWLCFHTGGNPPVERMRLDPAGALSVDGAFLTRGAHLTVANPGGVHLQVGSGINPRLWTRHIDGKHWGEDRNDGLFLNWSSGYPVHVGGAVRSACHVHGELTVREGGASVSGSLAVNGKSAGQDAGQAAQGGAFPAWSGGGVLGWDIFATGAVYVGANTDRPKVAIYNSGKVVGIGKFFDIPHPLDPDRRLVHGCIEGPETAVYYRGRGQLVAGRAVVRLPVYFEALVRREGRTVLVTPVLDDAGRACPVAASEVRDGTFAVAAVGGARDAGDFWWQVTGVRADLEVLDVEPTTTGEQPRVPEEEQP